MNESKKLYIVVKNGEYSSSQTIGIFESKDRAIEVARNVSTIGDGYHSFSVEERELNNLLPFSTRAWRMSDDDFVDAEELVSYESGVNRLDK